MCLSPGKHRQSGIKCTRRELPQDKGKQQEQRSGLKDRGRAREKSNHFLSSVRGEPCARKRECLPDGGLTCPYKGKIHVAGKKGGARNPLKKEQGKNRGRGTLSSASIKRGVIEAERVVMEGLMEREQQKKGFLCRGSTRGGEEETGRKLKQKLSVMEEPNGGKRLGSAQRGVLWVGQVKRHNNARHTCMRNR